MNVGKSFLQQLFYHRSVSNWTLGNSFELFTVQSLKKHRMDLLFCGGPGDRGVDFRGVWSLKSCKVNILGQCKCYKRKLGPAHFRELEGTLSHEQHTTLGMLVTNVGFTKDAYQHFMSSSYPLAMAVLDYFPQDVIGNKTDFVQYCSGSKDVNNKTDFLSNPRNRNFESRMVKRVASEEAMINAKHNNTSNSVKNLSINSSSINNRNMCGCAVANSYHVQNKDCRHFSEEACSTQRNKDEYNDSNNVERTCGGDLVLFDLNILARQLLPNVVIGKTMNKKKIGAPTLLFFENKTVISIT